MVNLEWYRSFVAVYRVGTVSGAAKFCSLTQPAVSQHLAALENITGFPLFKRSPRKMIPTERGKELYSQIAQSFDKLDQAYQCLNIANDTEKLLLRVGTPLEYFYEVGFKWMRDDAFRLWFEFDNAQNLAQKLIRDELDIIVTTQKISTGDIEYKYLFTESFLIVSSKKLSLPSDLDIATESVTTGKAGGLTDCEPLKAVYSTDSLTTFRWSTT